MRKYVFAILLSTLALKVYAPYNPIPFSWEEHNLKMLKQAELTLDNVKKYVKLVGIQHYEKVIAQFILETGWGKSYVCKKYNNLFGFRGSKGYMKYSHWTQSVEHYKRFQDKKYKGGDYYTFLVKIGYAEAGNYIQVLKTIKIKV